MYTDRRMDRKTDKKQTNEHMELHQFRKEPSYDGNLSLLCLNSIGHTLFELESRNENVDGQTDGQKNGQMDRQTDKRADRITAISKGT